MKLYLARTEGTSAGCEQQPFSQDPTIDALVACSWGSALLSTSPAVTTLVYLSLALLTVLSVLAKTWA